MDSPIWTEDGSEQLAFSPNSQEICFSRYTENETLTGNSNLFIVPARGGTAKAITGNKGSDAGPHYSPDGRYIAYRASVRPGNESDQTRLFVYDRRTAETRNVSKPSIGQWTRTCGPRQQEPLRRVRGSGPEPVARLDLTS